MVGYKFFVMERMHCQLTEVPSLLLHSTKAKTIGFGPIAVQLLKIVRAIQERKHVVLDMKPENFMLTVGPGKGSSVTQKIASRIRILDLALVQPWRSIGSHRDNEGTGGIAGTPLYASLNLHEGETPSRRDDLEALAYVMAELAIQISSGDASKSLPWVSGTSDEHIGELKKMYVENKKSNFYKHLGGAESTKTFCKFMDEVRSYGFKKTPDYDHLEEILTDWKITCGKKKAEKKSSVSGTRSSTRATQRTTRSRASRSDEDVHLEEDEAESIKEQDSMEVLSVSSGDNDDDTFNTAQMDWEVTPDENEEPSQAANSKDRVGVTVVVQSGPHQGQVLHLIKGENEECIVGSNPETSDHASTFSLPQDSDVDASHVRLQLVVKKRMISVLVVDLKSSGAYVGSEKIRKGKDYRIFRGESVKIGNSLLSVSTLDPNVSSVRSTSSSRKPRGNRKRAKAEEPETSQPMHNSNKKRRGVLLKVVEGPHQGESFEFEVGGVETYIVGSKPSGKTGEMLPFGRDSSLKANHVRLDLNSSKKLTTVLVTDKSKGETIVNRSKVKSGRAFINDRICIGATVLQIQPL